MLANYLKTAWRNLVNNKAFSFINIFGLAVGLATCTLIMLYLFSETGYDEHNKDAERIFRIASKAGQLGNVKEKPWAGTSAPIAWGIKEDLPEVEQSARLLKFPGLDKMLLIYKHGQNRKQFYETNGYYADSTFFQIFSYDFKYGNALTSLNKPNSIVISEEVAEKMFGKENPEGKLIQIGMPYGVFNYTVQGVFKDASIKSHIPAHFFLSMRNGDIGSWAENQTNWATNNIFYTYVKLKNGTDAKAFEKKLTPFLELRGGPDMKALGVSKQLFIQKLKDIYLYSDLENEIAPNGNITSLYILGSIALFVLLIACINFMNLSTARSGKRAKEVGIRKVMGAARISLVYQFLGESLLMSFLALVLAFLLASALLPLFNQLTQKNLLLFDRPELLLWMAGLTLSSGILSGFYPAFYLSSFRPIAVLKGKFVNIFSAIAIRKGLVVFQFTISICLISGALVIIKQMNYLKNKQLGFNKEEQIILPLQDQDAIKNYAVLKNELLKNPGIKNVSSGSAYPGIPNVEDMLFYPEGKSGKDEIDVHLSSVENDYFKTLGFTLLAGRGFSKEFTADSNSIVLNEAALKEFGYSVSNAVGKKLYFDFQGVHNSLRIVGVVKDFNFESLYNSIKPFGFTTGGFGNKYSYVIASVSAKNYAGLLKEIAYKWNKINPDIPFEYSFLDNDFQKNYEKDQRISVIVSYFTFIAILIACLGLFGLSAFSAEQRTREIGIRKVLGASISNITSLLSGDFIKLVLIAFVIASPLAWYGTNKWLQSFAYRIHLSWWVFLLAGLLAIIIALFTVSFQAIRAAITSPVNNLRTE
jgi:putative ABC transport system permease protein